MGHGAKTDTVLVVAEKRSVAQDIASVLGATREGQGFYSGGGHVVSWCKGHLVKLSEPARYDPAWSSWELSSLPMIPDAFMLEEREPGDRTYAVLERLLRDESFESVVNACDAGREGELIFGYVYELSGSRLPVQRLWISSLTPESIRDGFDNLSPGHARRGLLEAARARGQADWIVGLNATRCVTTCVRKTSPHVRGTLSVGRVQTPTLAMIVERHAQRVAFTPTAFHTITGTFTTSDGDRLDGVWVAATASVDASSWPTTPIRLDTREQARAKVEAFGGGTSAARVVHHTREERRKPAPRLFDLTSLQRVANTRLGMSAARTLELVQTLYERHKLLTYPRTDSPCISSDMWGTMPARLEAIAGWSRLSELAATISLAGMVVPKRVVDDARVTDHHAIIPTELAYSGRGLSKDEEAVYELVCRRTLAALSPPLHTSRTRVWVHLGGEGDAEGGVFFAAGIDVLAPGWTAVETQDEGDEADKNTTGTVLPKELGLGAELRRARVDSRAGRTSAPAALNDATLLSAMEHAGRRVDDNVLAAALSSGGLGTPATRASVIEGLIAREYVRRNARTLEPTERGVALIGALSHFPALVSPELTARWELGLSRIEAGELTREDFLAQVVSFTRAFVAHFTASPPRFSAPKKPVVGDCPACGHGLHIHPDGIYCSRLPRKECDLWVARRVVGKSLTDRQLVTLVTKGKTRELKGFKKRDGGTFSAPLALEHVDRSGWRARLDFPDAPAKAPPVPLQGVLCPECGGGLVVDERRARCAADGCGFSVWRERSGRRLSEDELVVLVATRRTPVLTGFTSRKSGRGFSAALELKRKTTGAWETAFVFADREG